ncbi:MAG: Mitotic exit network component [Vezdaea aestivalis]|nr:MAG: Mitotic exit network component [Vezdaea aestivalis]
MPHCLPSAPKSPPAGYQTVVEGRTMARAPCVPEPAYASPLQEAFRNVEDSHAEFGSNARSRGPFKVRNAVKGSNSAQLKQFADATLGSGSLRKAVKLPEGEDLNEWLAVNVVDFYNQINLLYGSITEFCSPQSCPEMKATDEFEYLWQDTENFKRPTKMSAPQYVEHLMAWVQSNIDNEQMFPSRIGVAFPKTFASLLRQMFKRLYRVYAHIYCHHYPVIVQLGLEPHLNTSFKHYVLFIDEHNLATGRDFWGPMGDLVETRAEVNLYSSLTTSLNPSPRDYNPKMMPIRTAGQVARTALPQRSIAIRPLNSSIRQYAQASAVSSKPPVPLFGLDGTYASALYTAAAKSSALEPTAKALASLSDVFKKDAKLTGILNTPTLSVSDKSQIIAELGKHTGGSKDEVIKNFLKTLADNNRLGLLEGVCEKFGVLMGAYRGEMELTVTSASPLDGRTLSRLEIAVAKSQYVGPGKKLKVKNKINADIMGGLVVEIGDRTIDLSVSSKIAKMNKLLTDSL